MYYIPALRKDGTSSPIHLTCGKYRPSDHRTSITCFHDQKQPKQEIYLNCHYQGVINILYAEHGYHSNFSSGGGQKCQPVYQRGCTRNAMGHYKLLESCMGLRECRVVISRETIPSCSHDSNYFQVEYQCIQGTKVAP